MIDRESRGSDTPIGYDASDPGYDVSDPSYDLPDPPPGGYGTPPPGGYGTPPPGGYGTPPPGGYGTPPPGGYNQQEQLLKQELDGGDTEQESERYLYASDL